MSQNATLIASNGIPLDNLKYNELGLRTLRLFLGEGPFYDRFKSRCDAADVAWFVAGAHKDGDHLLSPDSFHENWHFARQVSADDKLTKDRIRADLRNKLLDLLLDTATMLDRVTGSSTFVASNSPTVMPGQARTLENVKVHVYIPPHVLVESTRVERAVAEMVQKYVEALGLPSVLRWHRAFLKAGFSLPLINRSTPSSRSMRPFLPHAPSGSAHFICYGRAAGEIEAMLGQVPSAPANDHPSSAPQPLRSIPHATNIQDHRRNNVIIHDSSDGGDADDDDDDFTSVHSSEAEDLRARLDELEELLSRKDDEIKALRQKLKSSRKQVQELTQQLTAEQNEEMPAHMGRAGRAQPSAATVMPLASSPFAAAARPAASRKPATEADSTPSGRRHDRPSAKDSFGPSTPSQPHAAAPIASPTPSAATTTISSVGSHLSALSQISSPSRTGTPSAGSPRKAPVAGTPGGVSRNLSIGVNTDNVICEFQLNQSGISRELRRMMHGQPWQQWAQLIHDLWGFEQEVIDVLVDAMICDLDPEKRKKERVNKPQRLIIISIIPKPFLSGQTLEPPAALIRYLVSVTMSDAGGGHPADIVAVAVCPTQRTTGPSLSHEQRAQAAAARKVKQATIEEDIEGWYNDTVAFAEDLSGRFGSTPEHYLNMMFSGIFKLRATQRKPSAYNAWVHHLSKENAGMSATELVNMYRDQYDMLTAAQKEEYIQELVESRQNEVYGLRVGQRARIADVNHVCKSMDELARAGIEGFYCIVRSNVDYQLKPHWFFTSPPLEEFLRGSIRKFEPEKIGALAEAFSIAGSDFVSHLRSNKEKVNWLKSEIRALIAEALVSITGDQDAVMSYAQYNRDIRLKYGVDLKGWTHHKWTSPSHLGNNIGDLTVLRDALKGGKCYFVRLTADEKQRIQDEYDQEQSAVMKKKRSDAGKPRKKAARAAKRRRLNSDDGDSTDTSGRSE
ncbi:hypothetical protein BN946_scf184832.g2 [Trametes cinnabarina]|uniref:Uncharacterized protein n=1 Tax=Pycnoporus cinnabarinus TaxID=5643 RepID=A0A060SQD0_PYCCI|nr:hypothetical protein BN946_scf184832.g2 [Trametes cinnabarina]